MRACSVHESKGGPVRPYVRRRCPFEEDKIFCSVGLLLILASTAFSSMFFQNGVDGQKISRVDCTCLLGNGNGGYRRGGLRDIQLVGLSHELSHR